MFSKQCLSKHFCSGGMSNNVGHHGWLTTKNFKIALAKMPWKIKKKFGPENNRLKTSNLEFYVLIRDFLVESLKARKTSKKDHTLYKTISTKKPHSFHEPQLTQYYQKFTLTTQPKACFLLVSEKKTFAMHHF